jgi:hypothetical protein
MNETPTQFLAVGQDALVVGQDGKPHRATIQEVLGPNAARLLSLDGKASSISEYSETNEVNTFHFPSSPTASGKAEKKSEAK